MESSPSIEESRSALSGSGELARSVLFNNALDTHKSLATNAITCKSTSRPPSPVTGQMIWESDTEQVYFWNGTAWVTPANGAPSGSLNPFAGSTAPTGWLLCDGALYTVATYPGLYAVLGITYGGTIGVSFNVPDMRGNVPVGVKSTQVSNPDISALNKAAGTYTKTLNNNDLPNHTHTLGGTTGSFNASHSHGVGTLSAPAHTHATVGNVTGGFKATAVAALTGSGSLLGQSGSTLTPRDAGYTTGAASATALVGLIALSATGTGGSLDHSHTLPANTGNNGSTPVAVSLVQPSLALNYIIKT